mgnify:CR=1 FL=1
MFLTDNLWTIFEVAKEYRETGRGGDLFAAPDIYLNALKGREDLRCVQANPAKLAEWEAEDQAAALAEYSALVGHDIGRSGARRFKELTAAFTAGDRADFEAAQERGLAEYPAGAPEGVAGAGGG